MAENEILIVGAGPVGLTAAIELNRRGQAVRIVDRDPEPTSESRAIAIHPRTLDLLEAAGVTERLIGAGVRVKGVRVVAEGHLRATLDLTQIPHRFNFLLSLPQDRTERILLDALGERGVAVEQGTELTSLELAADGATVALAGRGGEGRERFAWVIGADGAHSAVRKALEIPFPGAPYPFEWSLADVDIDGPVEPDHVEAHLDPHRPILFRAPIGPNRHRLIANGPDALGRVPRTWRINAVHWNSSFKVSHRQAERVGAGRVWIVGDAAHIHSPAGGRGMNLGMEDATTLAERIFEGDIGSWPQERRAAAARWIAMSDRPQRAATNDGALARRVLPRLIALALALPPLRRRALANFIAT
jgi:2-polyprenyl-6-methoxyphenol hydroxylase-like FAD-dependent oxidoreductase